MQRVMVSKFIKITFFSCFLLSNATLFAQLENTDGKSRLINIPPNIEVEKHDFNDPRTSNEVSKEDAIKEILKKQLAEERKNIPRHDGIITPEELHRDKVKKQQGEIKKEYTKIDKYLGGFVSKSKNITIVCRDFQFPDGDEVTIYLNDVPVVRNIVLTGSFQQFTLPLSEGLNVISFVALNQGSSGPNTAGFMIFDDNAEIISANEWLLATGAKATLSIAKIK
ncbi:MAG: hypothetical protein L3J14_06250 [Flavobacteriaceae bacterium]|nr:hypothetical protein [Flavobacteriaceae bacterium]